MDMTDDLAPVFDTTEEPKKDTSKEWTLDAASRIRIDAAIEEIDAVQANSPTCALCGQRVRVLDRFGLCSKTSDPHEEWRREARANAKAGAR